MISMEVTTADLAGMAAGLEGMEDAMRRVAARAINRALVAARAETIRQARRVYAVRAADLRAALSISRATWYRPWGRLSASGAPGVPLIRFARTRRIPSTRRLRSGGYSPAPGIPVVIRRARGTIPASGAFLARMPSGHEGAFVRRGGKARTGKDAIIAAYGPSPEAMLEYIGVTPQVEARAMEVFEAEMVRGMERARAGL